MTPWLPVLAAPVTVIRTTAGLTLAATAIVADDSSMVTGWMAPALVGLAASVDGGGRPVERAGRAEREDGATRGEDRGQQRAASDDRAAAATAVAAGRRWSARPTRRGVGGGLVPALGGHGRRVVPGARPVGARLGAGV